METPDKEEPKNSWIHVDEEKFQLHVTIRPDDPNTNLEVERVVYMDDLEKRKEAYGICGECKEPGVGKRWCQPCNAKRFRENFKNWTSGNKDIDELIQYSQLNAVHRTKYLEWIPFEKLEKVTYVTKGGFGKVYSAVWTEGYIEYWDIENQQWKKWPNIKVALKSLDNSSNISVEFLNEIRSHLQVYITDVIQCFGITQHPDTKNYGMVLKYCLGGNLRDFITQKPRQDYESKIEILSYIAKGLLDIHNSGKVHKDFHSGNILLNKYFAYISDLGMCRPANDEKSVDNEGVYGVLPYVAPEILRGHQYTKPSDIYSFGIIMNEYLSEEIPYNDISHDHVLAVKICKGLRPKISNDVPKLLVDWVVRCWDAKVDNRPTANDLFKIFNKWTCELRNRFSEDGDPKNGVIFAQIEESKKIRENKLKDNPSKNESGNIQTHPQAIYTSRFLNYKNLPEPINSTYIPTKLDDASQSMPTIPFSINLDLDCQVEPSDLINESSSDDGNGNGK